MLCVFCLSSFCLSVFLFSNLSVLKYYDSLFYVFCLFVCLYLYWCLCPSVCIDVLFRSIKLSIALEVIFEEKKRENMMSPTSPVFHSVESVSGPFFRTGLRPVNILISSLHWVFLLFFVPFCTVEYVPTDRAFCVNLLKERDESISPTYRM